MDVGIRLAVDGVVVRDGALLVVVYDDAHLGRHFGLPGGGVEPGETIHEAVRREVREETGAEVEVGRLLLVNEYVPGDYASLYGDGHDVRLVFHCTCRAGVPLAAPSLPDLDQVGVEWLSLDQLPVARLYPRIGPRLHALLASPPSYDPFNTAL